MKNLFTLLLLAMLCLCGSCSWPFKRDKIKRRAMPSVAVQQMERAEAIEQGILAVPFQQHETSTLLSYLKHRSFKVRSSAVNEFIRRQDKSVARAIVPLLSDSSEEVQVTVEYYLNWLTGLPFADQPQRSRAILEQAIAEHPATEITWANLTPKSLDSVAIAELLSIQAISSPKYRAFGGAQNVLVVFSNKTANTFYLRALWNKPYQRYSYTAEGVESHYSQPNKALTCDMSWSSSGAGLLDGLAFGDLDAVHEIDGGMNNYKLLPGQQIEFTVKWSCEQVFQAEGRTQRWDYLDRNAAFTVKNLLVVFHDGSMAMLNTKSNVADLHLADLTVFNSTLNKSMQEALFADSDFGKLKAISNQLERLNQKQATFFMDLCIQKLDPVMNDTWNKFLFAIIEKHLPIEIVQEKVADSYAKPITALQLWWQANRGNWTFDTNTGKWISK